MAYARTTAQVPSLFGISDSSTDPNWIIILFFIHLDVFKEEKLEEPACGNNFVNGTQFGELGSETFYGHFEDLNGYFWG